MMIDIHNHVLIGIDDGPRSEEEALALLRQAIDNGITDIVASPHHYSGDFINFKSKIMDKMDELNTIIDSHQLEVKIYPGQEIRMNGSMVEELNENKSIPLNGSKYVLVEFPFNDIPSYAETLLFDLQMNGYTPMIAHPERCKPIIKDPDKLYDFIEKGAISQVTAGSVSGALGDNLQETCLKMIENNLTHMIASDAHHAETRPFLLKEAYEAVSSRLGESFTERLQHNASAVLHNKEMKAKQPNKIDTHYQNKRKRNKKKFFGIF